MSTPLAYFVVVLIWSTTPLALKWSVETGSSTGSLFARIALATVIGLLYLHAIKRPLRWHKTAVHSYVIAAIGLFGSLGLVYLAAPAVSSGLIAVINGLGPLMTGLLNQFWPNATRLRAPQWFGCLLGFGGIFVVFGDALNTRPEQLPALCMLLVATVILSGSAIALQRVKADEHPLNQTVGTLLVTTPFFGLLWLGSGQTLDLTLTLRATSAIVYLAVIGSLTALLCYYLLLTRLSAAAVSMVSLITPVIALALGTVLNGERPGASIWIGTALIISALATYLLTSNPRPAIKDTKSVAPL